VIDASHPLVGQAMSGGILDACAASRARLTHAHTNRRCCRNPHSRQAPRASGNLRSALWRLNGVGISLLNADKYTLAIRDQIAIDIDAVDAWAARLISGHPVPTDLVVMPCGVDAVELLPGWYDEWALIERERVRQRLLHGLEALSRHLIVEGRCAEAVEAASYTGYAIYGRWHKVEDSAAGRDQLPVQRANARAGFRYRACSPASDLPS